jgi:hypothetical protein
VNLNSTMDEICYEHCLLSNLPTIETIQLMITWSEILTYFEQKYPQLHLINDLLEMKKNYVKML